MKRFALAICFLFFFIRCEKEVGPVSENVNSSFPFEHGVAVLNEGAFQWNNASITLRDQSGTLAQGVFEAINDRSLGDVLHSFEQYDGSYFLVVNNSGKIEEVDQHTFTSIKTFSGLKSPRYMEIIDEHRALVTNFVLEGEDTPNEIDLVDIRSGQKLSQINVRNWCEQLIASGNRVFVANTGSDKLLIIDKNSLAIELEIPTPPQPMEMVIDRNGMLWVLCIGRFEKHGAALCRFDPFQLRFTKILTFQNPDAYPSGLCIGENGEYLYFIETGVVKMHISDLKIPVDRMVDTRKINAYGLGVETGTGNIYVGDAGDFNSDGQVLVHNKDGDFLHKFKTGVIPGNFIFR